MQDEINSKTVALVINIGKKGVHLIADLLKAAMRKYLRDMEQKKNVKRQEKQHKKLYGKHGKQTVGELMKQNQGLTNIEVTDGNIKSFERVANKYNIDFALKKADDRYLVFFKGRDADVLTAAFREFSKKKLDKERKPSVRRDLAEKKAEAAQTAKRDKVKNMDRGIDR